MAPKKNPSSSSKEPMSSSTTKAIAKNAARDQNQTGGGMGRGKRLQTKYPRKSDESQSPNRRSYTDGALSLQEKITRAAPQSNQRTLACQIPSGSGGLTRMETSWTGTPMDIPPQRYPKPFGISSVDIPLETMVKENSMERSLQVSRDVSRGGDWSSGTLSKEPQKKRDMREYGACSIDYFREDQSLRGAQDHTDPVSWSPRNALQYGDVNSDFLGGASFGSVEFSETLRYQYETMMTQESTQQHQITPQSSHFGERSSTPGMPHDAAVAAAMEMMNLDPSNSVILDTTDIVAKPAIFVVPLRAVNFTGLHIQFSIQVFNLPPNCGIMDSMFETTAEAPSRQQLPCYIRRDNPMGENGRFPSTLVTFVGRFRATEEVGLYTLRVRLILPMTETLAHFKLHSGVVSDSTGIVVSRNYLRKSRKLPPIVHQLKFQSYEKMNIGDCVVESSKAWGIACDKATNFLYFTERVGNQVSCMDPNGRILFRFHQKKPESRLKRPTGIYCDERNRRVLVCDKDNHRICFFTMEGEYISSFGALGYHNGMFQFPWDVAVNSDGTRIIVADSRNKRIQLFDGFGNFLSKYTMFEKNPLDYKRYLDYPRGVAFDPDGQIIYVTDFNSQNIIVVPIQCDTSKRLVTEKKMGRPQGIVVDQIGSLLVADSRNNCICHFFGDGQSLSTIHTIGNEPIYYPVNLTLMRDGYVATLDGRGRVNIF